MATAFVFPGQGSQKVSMGHDLFTSSKVGKKYFDLANEIMGTDIQSIIFNGPEEKLKETQYTQPAIYIVSVILGHILLEEGQQPDMVAGHSLGEYSACTIAGSLTFETGLSLVKLRAESMQDAGTTNPGTMAAIIGMTDEDVISMCNTISSDESVVVAANFNYPGQVVISGNINAVHETMEKAPDLGAKMAKELNVSGAFHSPLMEPAKKRLSAALDNIEINTATMPVYANVTAEPMIEADEIRSNLKNQLDCPVKWHETIDNMKTAGATEMMEVGPGRVLQGLNRRIDKKLTSKGVETLEQIKEIAHV
ncbi:MAG: ACP S-malonyltransferase [Candidatus Marinimicrobia bacterium]|nr:ACP S-malonyltransferase [Candidatus Neomarinimicrobiota bacterium]